MVHNKVHIPLCQKLETGSFWKYHTKERVYVFHTAFLATSHWIAEVDAGSLNAVSSGFKGQRIPEFTTAVGKDIFKDHVEHVSPEAVFQTVKDKPYSALCTLV